MAQPGLVLVWSKGEPQLRTLRLPLDTAFVIGRELVPNDERTSAKHAIVCARADDFVVTNTGSRNGTFVDGEEVTSQKLAWDRSVLRTGSSLWLVCADLAPFEALVPARDPSTSHAPHTELRAAAIGFAIRDTVRAALPIHYSIVQRCLMSAWRDRAALVSAIEAALDRASGSDRLREEHLPRVVPLRPVVPFARFFELVMKARPPFAIPASYHCHATIRRDGGIPYETLIASDKTNPVLVQMQLGDALRDGDYFMAGFWGHGVTSYSVYLARRTERQRLFLRLPYGDGAYCTDPDRERAQALEKLERLSWLADTLPVKHVTLLESLGTAHYELLRYDGTVVSCPPQLSSLDDIDFLALAMGD
ncbi:MAG TPA: FHA domain-containing protein [Kofleriaceae bacterium]|nr:FHA domain-containing protein [Kofleriaceae bacterium]